MSEPAPGQLELFDLSRQQAPVMRHESVGRFLFNMRHDQLILAAIGALIGLTVLFAFGVERGKQIARHEEPLIEPQVLPAVAAPAAVVAPTVSVAEKPTVDEPAAAKPAASKAVAQKADAPKKSSGGKFIVQVATYSKPQLARAELQRLQDRGEKAFLVTRQGRVSLCVGPFESKRRATEKLATLRDRYQDGFVKTL